MPITFYLNTTVNAEADTSLAGITSAQDGLSFHDQCSRTFDLNKHMLKDMYVTGGPESAEGQNYNMRSILVSDVSYAVIPSAIGNQTTEEDQTRLVILQAFDEDGEVIAYAATSADTSKATVSITNVSDSTDAFGRTSEATLTMVPAANFHGDVAITVTATDSNNSKVEETFTLTVTPKADTPVLGNIPAQFTAKNDSKEITLSATDADGDAVTYSASSSDDTKVTVSIVGQKLTMTPVADFLGDVNITVSATDTDGNTSAQQTFQLSVIEGFYPALQLIGAQTTPEDHFEPKVISLSATDQNSDDVTFTASSDNANVTAAISNANITARTADLTLTPAAHFNGQVNITVTATDATGLTHSETFTLTVTPMGDLPVLGEIGAQTAGKNNPKTITLSATDADGDAVTYTAVSTDENKATVSIAGDQLTMTPAAGFSGDVDITVTATDPDNNSNSETFTLTVQENNTPVLDQIGTQITKEDTEKVITLSSVDLDGHNVTYTATSANANVTVSVNGNQLTMKPATNFRGDADITVTATDPDGNNVSETFNLTVTNPPLLGKRYDTNKAMTLEFQPDLVELQNENDQLPFTRWADLPLGRLTIKLENSVTNNTGNDGLYEAEYIQQMGTATEMGLDATATVLSNGTLTVAINNGGTGYSTSTTLPINAQTGVEFEISSVSGNGVVTAMTAQYMDMTQTPPVSTTTPPSGTTSGDTYTFTGTAFDKTTVAPGKLRMYAVKGGEYNHDTGRLDNAFFSEFDETLLTGYSIESAERSEVLEENMDRISVKPDSKLNMGRAEWSTSTNNSPATFDGAQIAYGFRDNNNNLQVNEISQATGLYANQQWAQAVASGKHSLIDAFTDSSTPEKLALLEKDDKMWESLLTQLALSGIQKYVKNVDYSATNLIDFGTPLTQLKSSGVIAGDENASRGLNNYYRGYVTNAADNTRGASTWSEMVRTAEDLALGNGDSHQDSIHDALTSLAKQLAASGRVDQTSTETYRVCKMNPSDVVHITLEIAVTDADDSTGTLPGLTSMSPKYLALATRNPAEESNDCTIEEYGQYLRGESVDLNAKFTKPLLKLGDEMFVVKPKFNSFKPALRIRLTCTHQS